jgi:type I restriction enzyme, S subunit
MTAKRHRMKELCEITSSKRIFAADYQPEGIPFYRGKEITEKHKGNLDVTTELFIDPEKFEAIRAKFGAPVAGDLLLTSVGTLGSPYVVRAGETFYFKDGNLTWFRKLKNLDSRYLYYWLLSPHGRAELKKCTIGSSQSAYTIVLLKDMEIDLPSLPTQRKIAGILSAYDDLIENNLRRIKILEQMAQLLYREWFVHFRFPGHESVKCVDSELGQIPKGWGVSDLEKVTTKIGSGATPRGGKDSYKPDGITLIRSMNIYDYSFEFDSLAFIDPKQAAQLDNVSVEAHDVLLNITGASVCRCAMVPSYLLPARVNQHVAIIRANTEVVDPHFLLDSINSEQNKKTLFTLAQGGATREALTKETICRFQILLPQRDLIFRYGRIAGAMHIQREGLQRKNQTLRRTRDLLLPKLLQNDSTLTP